MNCPTEGCPKTTPYGQPGHTMCWMPSRSVRRRLAVQRNRVTVSLIENIVQRPPPQMKDWRFYRIEYSNGLETAIWLPPDCDPDSIEALLEGRQDV